MEGKETTSAFEGIFRVSETVKVRLGFICTTVFVNSSVTWLVKNSF